MRHLVPWMLVLAVGCLPVATSKAPGAGTPTVLTVPGIDCAGCAKTITATLREVPGVASAQVDVATKTVTVTPKPQGGPSDRALWEALEQAEFPPTKLVGPNGAFTAKPKL
jgi:copper chaperone CopZ